MHVNLLVARLPRLVLTVLLGVLPTSAATTADNSLFARSNLVAWCIVPFDAKQRSPEARAAMLERLRIQQLAYDYRAEHVPTFDAEIEALRRHHIRLLAWWFPGVLNDEARLILDVLERHQLRGVQLWVSGGGEPATPAGEQAARVAAEALRIQPIATAAGRLGCSVALYNHGGWFGEPENQIAIIERLRAAGVTNVGIVYNQHHGHDHVARFASLLALMKPYLVALNLNGMARDGDQLGKKILPLGQGELDLQLLNIIRESGWRGPIGILNHTDEDAEARLLDNLEGLDWLLKQTPGHPVGPKPQPRTWRAPPAQTSAGGARLLPSQDRIPGVVARQEPRPTGFTATEQGRNEPGALAEPAPGRAGSPPPAGTGAPGTARPTSKYWAVEDRAAREKLPLDETVPEETAGLFMNRSPESARTDDPDAHPPSVRLGEREQAHGRRYETIVRHLVGLSPGVSVVGSGPVPPQSFGSKAAFVVLNFTCPSPQSTFTP